VLFCFHTLTVLTDKCRQAFGKRPQNKQTDTHTHKKKKKHLALLGWKDDCKLALLLSPVSMAVMVLHHMEITLCIYTPYLPSLLIA